MSPQASLGALAIPPHACAGVPTSLSICQGCGDTAMHPRAVPAPRFAAKVLWAEGRCSWLGPRAPDSQPPRATSLCISLSRVNPRRLPEAHKCRRTPNSSVTHRELSEDLSCLISALKESPSRWVTHQRAVMCSTCLRHLLSSFLYPGLAAFFFLFLMNK